MPDSESPLFYKIGRRYYQVQSSMAPGWPAPGYGIAFAGGYAWLLPDLPSVTRDTVLRRAALHYYEDAWAHEVVGTGTGLTSPEHNGLWEVFERGAPGFEADVADRLLAAAERIAATYGLEDDARRSERLESWRTGHRPRGMLYRRTGTRYRAVGEEFVGFPTAGVWRVPRTPDRIFRYANLERLADLPRPTPIADLMARRSVFLACAADAHAAYRQAEIELMGLDWPNSVTLFSGKDFVRHLALRLTGFPSVLRPY